MVIIDDSKTTSLEPSWLSESEISDYSTAKREYSLFDEETLSEKLLLYPNDPDFCLHHYKPLSPSETRSCLETNVDGGIDPVINERVSPMLESKCNFDSDHYPSHLSKSAYRNFSYQQELQGNKDSIFEFPTQDLPKQNTKSSISFENSSRVLQGTNTARTPFMVDPNNLKWNIMCNRSRQVSSTTSKGLKNPWTRGLTKRPSFTRNKNLFDGSLEYHLVGKNFGEEEVESKTKSWVGDVSRKTRFVQERRSDFRFKGSSHKHPGTWRTRSESVKFGLQDSSPAWDLAHKASKSKRYTTMRSKMNVASPDGSYISIMDKWLKARCEQLERERTLHTSALRLEAVE